MQGEQTETSPRARRNVQLSVNTQMPRDEDDTGAAEAQTPTPRVRLRWSPRPVLSPSPRGAVPEAALMIASSAASTPRSSNPQDANANMGPRHRMRAGAGFHRERVATLAELPFVQVSSENAVTVSFSTA